MTSPRFPWVDTFGLVLVAGLLSGMLSAVMGILILLTHMFDPVGALLGKQLMGGGLLVALAFGLALRKFDAWRFRGK